MAVMVTQDTVCILSRDDFAVKSDRLRSVTIDSLPSKGTLLYDDKPMTETGLNVSAIDILIGNLTFQPEPGESGGSYATFDYTSHTGTGLEHSGYLILDVVPGKQPSSGEGNRANHTRH